MDHDSADAVTIRNRKNNNRDEMLITEQFHQLKEVLGDTKVNSSGMCKKRGYFWVRVHR